MRMQPVTILIAAMGGEGGGVLTDWIVSAAQASGLPVQGTSIPGVAQRTGATTYYIELWPETHTALGAKRPVFGLGPSPGDVDVVVATELMEAGRCAELGYVSPNRTTLIAAARRVYSTAEKVAMGDGRVDTERVMRALREMPRHAVLFDPDRHPGMSLNALAFGVLAGSGAVPLLLDACRSAIGASGIAVKANLAAFEAGLALATAPVTPDAVAPLPKRAALPDLLRHAAAELPPEVLAVADHALPRLTHYQSAAYARLWLERLRPIVAADPAPGGTRRIAAECGRHLALWMSYEDVIRVAQLKADPARFETIRAEVRAAPDQPVHVTDHMKPGLDELSSLLPPGLGLRLRAWGERTGRAERWSLPMRLRSSTILGLIRLRALAGLRRWRPRSLRYAEEQAAIEAWLDRVKRALERGQPTLALEIVGCATLLKGYAETHRRGRRAFALVMERVVDPALAAPSPESAGRVARAREAALADPEHRALEATLARIAAEVASPPLAQAAA